MIRVGGEKQNQTNKKTDQLDISLKCYIWLIQQTDANNTKNKNKILFLRWSKKDWGRGTVPGALERLCPWRNKDHLTSSRIKEFTRKAVQMGVEGGIGYEEGKLRGGKEEEKGFMREEG